MGSFRATLEIGGEKLDVLYAKTAFSRLVTPKGKVATGVKGGDLQVRVEANAKTVLAEMMLNSQFKPFDCKLVYYQAEDEAEMRTTEIKHAYIVEYREVLDADNGDQMTIYCSIAGEEMIIGGATHLNRWSNNA
ncbi:MAG: hypothetical protein MK066_11370 [Crocinitomicaceae bacterium]|nr:hypothetical protein [Crocinitomicaceae bacterium]